MPVDLGAVKGNMQCWSFRQLGHGGAEFEARSLQTHIIVSRGHWEGDG